MSEIKRKRNESFESFLRRVKQNWQKSGRILEVRKGQHFASKPGKNRRRTSTVARLKMKAQFEHRKKTGRLSAEEKAKLSRTRR